MTPVNEGDNIATAAITHAPTSLAAVVLSPQNNTLCGAHVLDEKIVKVPTNARTATVSRRESRCTTCRTACQTLKTACSAMPRPIRPPVQCTSSNLHRVTAMASERYLQCQGDDDRVGFAVMGQRERVCDGNQGLGRIHIAHTFSLECNTISKRGALPTREQRQR